MSLRLTGLGSNNVDEDFDRDERKFRVDTDPMAEAVDAYNKAFLYQEHAAKIRHPVDRLTAIALAGLAADRDRKDIAAIFLHALRAGETAPRSS
jgi:hypothetical protein